MKYLIWHPPFQTNYGHGIVIIVTFTFCFTASNMQFWSSATNSCHSIVSSVGVNISTMRPAKKQMNKKPNTCYMCESFSTGGEHVPPRCLFPEKKDLPAGMDLRKNLFKVPSCDVHNLQKSLEDEYLLYILNSCIQINEVGRNQYRTKIRRAQNRNPSLLKKIAAASTPLEITYPLSENNVSSMAFKLEEDRFNTIIDRLSRAIYFHHFQEKWLGHVKYQAEFLFATTNPLDESNVRCETISNNADEWFSRAIYHGENPEVFKYQEVENNESRKMRLHFYEGCKLLLIFDNQ